jgi:uncharacterized protein YuzE
MLIVHSHNGVPTRLTEERWQHIMQRHPDMETQRERVLETMTEPDMIQDDDSMEAIRILDKPTAITWDYDEDADVLYLSLGEPRPAVGVDIGEGVIVRYDEVRQEVVGLTLLGLRARLLQGLSIPPYPDAG